MVNFLDVRVSIGSISVLNVDSAGGLVSFLVETQVATDTPFTVSHSAGLETTPTQTPSPPVGPPPPSVTVTNIASVTGYERDTDANNNTAAEITTVKPAAATPEPTPFPVFTVVSSDQVTPVALNGDVVSVVQPTSRAIIVLPGQDVRLDIPAPVQQQTFQVAAKTIDPGKLPSQDGSRFLRAFRIDLFDHKGKPLRDVRLWFKARPQRHADRRRGEGAWWPCNRGRAYLRGKAPAPEAVQDRRLMDRPAYRI